MIVTSMQLKISSRRDIAVLQKESRSFRAERMSSRTPRLHAVRPEFLSGLAAGE